MQKEVTIAINAAREKFGYQLDFSEKSIMQLESLLQRAHEWYLRASDGGNLQGISIENTSKAWGSYLGEMICKRTNGCWIESNNEIYLQLDSQVINPIGLVKERIYHGPKIDVIEYYKRLTTAQPSENDRQVADKSAKEQEDKNKLIQMKAALDLTLSKLNEAEKRIAELEERSTLNNQEDDTQIRGITHLTSEMNSLPQQVREVQSLKTQKDEIIATINQKKADLEYFNQKIMQKKSEMHALEQESAEIQNELTNSKFEQNKMQAELDDLQEKKLKYIGELRGSDMGKAQSNREDGFFGELPDFIK